MVGPGVVGRRPAFPQATVANALFTAGFISATTCLTTKKGYPTCVNLLQGGCIFVIFGIAIAASLGWKIQNLIEDLTEDYADDQNDEYGSSLHRLKQNGLDSFMNQLYVVLVLPALLAIPSWLALEVVPSRNPTVIVPRRRPPSRRRT